jgi:N-acetylglucosaminyl-diphospho-decaprenol L-rhamnosyltransferase
MPSFDVAVVIVTYKSAQLTIQSLRSLESERASSGLNIRATGVDNASGDLPAIQQALGPNGWSSWVTLVPAPMNGGFAYGNNLGVQHAYAAATPDYIYLLNPDAEVRPGAISALVRFLEARPDVGIAGSSFEYLDGRDWPMAFRFPTIWSELSEGLQIGLVARLLNKWVVARRMTQITQPIDWICGASMMIRPAVFAAIGGFDENYFLYFEETDFCNRALKAGFSTWYVPESRVMHIMGQSTRITDETLELQRRPAYWFESRRRYFAVTFGVGHAMLIGLVAFFSGSLGLLKRTVQRRRGVPYYLRDLLKHTILWSHNRQFPEVRCLLSRN